MQLHEVAEDNAAIAKRLLHALKGYTARQTLMTEDVATVVSLLDQWDGQVGVLEDRIVSLHETVLEKIEEIGVLRSENDTLKTQSGLRGVMSYLKARSGLV